MTPSRCFKCRWCGWTMACAGDEDDERVRGAILMHVKHAHAQVPEAAYMVEEVIARRLGEKKVDAAPGRE